MIAIIINSAHLYIPFASSMILEIKVFHLGLITFI
jgi:hypothetical protein